MSLGRPDSSCGDRSKRRARLRCPRASFRHRRRRYLLGIGDARVRGSSTSSLPGRTRTTDNRGPRPDVFPTQPRHELRPSTGSPARPRRDIVGTSPVPTGARCGRPSSGAPRSCSTWRRSRHILDARPPPPRRPWSAGSSSGGPLGRSRDHQLLVSPACLVEVKLLPLVSARPRTWADAPGHRAGPDRRRIPCRPPLALRGAS